MSHATRVLILSTVVLASLVGADKKKHDGTFHKKQGITGPIHQIQPRDKFRRYLHLNQDVTRFTVQTVHTVWCNESDPHDEWRINIDKIDWETSPKEVGSMIDDVLTTTLTPTLEYPGALVRAKVVARPHPGGICQLCEHVKEIPDNETRNIKWEEDQPANKLYLFQTIVQIDNPKEGLVEIAETDDKPSYGKTIASSGVGYVESTPNKGRYYTGGPRSDSTGPMPHNTNNKDNAVLAGNACTWMLIAGYKNYTNPVGGLAVNGKATMKGRLTLTPSGGGRNYIQVRLDDDPSVEGMVDFSLTFASLAVQAYLTGGTQCLAWKCLIKATVKTAEKLVKDAVCSSKNKPSVTGMIRGSVAIEPDANGQNKNGSASRQVQVDGVFLAKKNLDKYRWSSRLPPTWAAIPPWNSATFTEDFTHSVDLRSVDQDVRRIAGRGAIEGAYVANGTGIGVFVKVHVRPYRLKQILFGFEYKTNRKPSGAKDAQ